MRKKPLFTGLLLLQLVLSAGLSTNARADDPMDFGDADVGFPVYFTDDGARHIINPGVKMGTLVDEEADGTPSLLADVDDLDGDDDEDGVVFSRVSRPGETTMVSVVVSTSGYLQGWVDLDGFDWLGDGEHVYSNLFVTAGTNELSLVFPPDITPGIYQSRFRFSTVTNLEPTGEAPDGEVEDHVVYVFDADFGDAPEGIANGQYPTRFANTGAFHALGSGVFMGAGVTRDDDGLPAPDAQLDDDDGVSFLTALELGKTASIAVVLSSSASLSLWMDFDGDGSWNDADEFVYVEGLTAGTNVLYVAIPATAMFGKSYARFRLSTETVSYPYGYAADGEVEDYAIDLQTFDYGDAPEGIGPLGNPTLLTNNGPRHAVVTGVYLGESIDAELDGQPTIVAHGDDTHGAEDEDGVQFEPNVYPGLSMAVQVVASTGGLLQAWIDFNQNQSWADPGEQVLSNRVVVAGTNNLAIAIPVTASFGATFTRFRFSTQGDLGYAGAAADGEVEDYQVDFQEPFFDFGDAPHDPPFTNYPVSLIHNGPRHVIVPNIQLGSLIDQDFDGQPGPGADGDDNDGNDDDDGVALPGPLVPGFPGVAVVDASTGGYVQAWMDFNADGDWDEAREQVFSNIWVNGGVTNLAFQLPADTVAPQLFARFRFSRVPDLGVRGAAPDGEVEDLLATIDGFDFGDARGSLTLSSTPTRYSEDGARHLVVPGVHLGELIDSEPDGLPTPAADGDDTDASDDEDGVLFETYLLSGAPSSVMLTVSTTGYVQGWIDFNQDNVWGNGDEQFSKDQWVDTGTTNLVFVVPPLAMPGLCSARVRFSSVTNLPPTGMAPDGEVEDYVVIIRAPDLGDAPDSLGDPRYPTLIAHDGARHSIVTGIHLGDGVDGDSDGQPTSTADGDDTDGEDDDDGVLLLRPMRPGETTAIRVLASTNGYLQGWVDTEGDGDWSGPDEFLMQDVWLDAGYHVVPLTPSVTATVGTTFARYRFSTEPGLDVIGLAGDGEVEDYAVTIQALLPPESPAVDPCTEWLQRVNTNYGIDVASYGVPSIGGSGGHPVRVADDWPADGRAIGGVRWWGSHIGWRGNPAAIPASSRPFGFKLYWFDDAATTNGFNLPGDEITNVVVTLLPHGVTSSGTGVVTELYVAASDLSFSGPGEFEYEYQYDVRLPAAWPVRSDRSYWLVIEALYSAFPFTYRWGWCTAWPAEAYGSSAVSRKSNESNWSPMSYPPNIIPWAGETNHPDTDLPVALAFELFTEDCPRQASLWPQWPPVTQPDGAESWSLLSLGASYNGRMADDFVADGRLITRIRWQGVYPGWLPVTQSSAANPVPPPPGSDHPLGFSLELYAAAPACAPDVLITNIFVPQEQLDEAYLKSMAFILNSTTQWLQVYQYDLDLLDPHILGSGWRGQAGTTYWFSVQAVFGSSFIPGGAHDGWGWLTADTTQQCPTVESLNGGLTWREAWHQPGHPQSGQPFDCVFDLLSIEPGESPWYDRPEIEQFRISDSLVVEIDSTGDLGAGIQVLQMSTDLVANSWQDVATNSLPRNLPYTNRWQITAPESDRVLLRVQQR